MLECEIQNNYGSRYHAHLSMTHTQKHNQSECYLCSQTLLKSTQTSSGFAVKCFLLSIFTMAEAMETQSPLFNQSCTKRKLVS